MYPIGPVPPEFKSVYRLFLRSLLRSVGNQYGPFSNLRRLYRPLFRTAARNIIKLDDAEREAQHANLRIWLQTWDRRVDGTLALLANASQTYGLPSTLLSNLALVHLHVKLPFLPLHRRSTWNSHQAQDGTNYLVPDYRPGTRETNRRLQELRWRQIDEDVYNPVGEAIKLAEGRNNLTLGRVFRTAYVP
ncbi:uncharacterized protein PHACADRAFT_260038 [Phanerochaete carnosa HHB-10118-sp]|uniref:Uncharacterized protein n=1 Tax=Phanerochaete carnosa (strain HHB-10118-sp) TaxID=650164 RepID=K5UUC5_PHACS|nr:uncharacterized protein PHACADRAFT_260038 [Phanerochaete carnosa HHB-10118-sp]EKM53601.1 hypothetical protein PHACADRAFT_260038 [Phanerochaete carnosa HHB-10118-sp]